MNQSVHRLLETISNDLNKVNINKYTKYFENGMEYDDFNELKVFCTQLTNVFSE